MTESSLLFVCVCILCVCGIGSICARSEQTKGFIADAEAARFHSLTYVCAFCCTAFMWPLHSNAEQRLFNILYLASCCVCIADERYYEDVQRACSRPPWHTTIVALWQPFFVNNKKMNNLSVQSIRTLNNFKNNNFSKKYKYIDTPFILNFNNCCGWIKF